MRTVPWPVGSDALPPTYGQLSNALVLDVEAELDHVAVRHDVILALHAHLACGLGCAHGSCSDQVVEGNNLGLDEAALEVGMDDTGRLGRRRAFGNRPGAGLLRAGCQVGLQPERVEADAGERIE